MDFAPYQDNPPAIERALSPPPPSGVRSPRVKSPPPHPQANRPNGFSRANPDSSSQPLPPPESFADAIPSSSYYQQPRADPIIDSPQQQQQQRNQSLEAFQTSLPLRLDYEAMLAYILLPPAGGVFLLLVEHKSDYVRFHAFQGAMLFSILFVVHLCVSWSVILSWGVLVVDLAFMVFMAGHAYRDVESLEHYELPVLGRLANGWVDEE